MASLLDRLLELWINPITDESTAVTAFREVYADPVSVNGAWLAASDLVARARALHDVYDELRLEVVDRVETTDRIALGMRMYGRHVGPLATPLGTVAPSGRFVENRVIDILTVEGGRVTAIWMVADDLGVLVQLGAVTLA